MKRLALIIAAALIATPALAAPPVLGTWKDQAGQVQQTIGVGPGTDASGNPITIPTNDPNNSSYLFAPASR